MTKRYIVMSIPGRRDDGRDTWWFVFDVKLHKSVPDAGLPGYQGQIKVAKLARFMNERSKKLAPALRGM